MATTTAKGSGSTNNNGAVIPRAGNVDGRNVTTAPNNLTQGNITKQGNLPINSSNVGTMKAITANTFARGMFEGQFIVRGYGYLNGASSDLLNSPGIHRTVTRRSIHVKENRRSYHITSWNYETGVATKGAGTNDSFGTDDAARPTRALPGEYVYSDHGLAGTGALAIPLRADYEAKTSG